MKINNHTLVAKTITENHIENQISITMSDSRESFFGKTYYGNWITGTRVNANSKYNDIATNRSSPLKTFYSFNVFGIGIVLPLQSGCQVIDDVITATII